MQLSKTLSVLGVTLIGMVLATSASAFTLEEQTQFTEAETAKVVKHHARPYVITLNEDGSLNVYRGNKRGTNWKQLDEENTSIADLPTNVVDLGKVRIFKNTLYMAVNTEDGAEVWSISLRKRPAVWQQSGEDGLSVEGESVTALFNQYASRAKNADQGGLYAFTTTADGAQLVMTEDGDTWTAVGEAGLGNEIDEVVSGARVRSGSDIYAYIATADAMIYSSPIDDLETWTLAYDMSDTADSITHMRTYRGKMYVATVDSTGVDIWYTTDGETYTQLDDEGEFDGATNARMSAFGKFGKRPLHVSVEHTTDGGTIATVTNPKSVTPDLEMVLEDGEDSWYTHTVRSRGRLVVGNNVEGATLYRVTK